MSVTIRDFLKSRLFQPTLAFLRVLSFRPVQILFRLAKFESNPFLLLMFNWVCVIFLTYARARVKFLSTRMGDCASGSNKAFLKIFIQMLVAACGHYWVPKRVKEVWTIESYQKKNKPLLILLYMCHKILQERPYPIHAVYIIIFL